MKMYDLLNFHKVCRVCLMDKLENLQPLHKYKSFFFISTIIHQCDEDIKDLTNLPYNICQVCLEGLKASENFKNKCDVSNKYLIENLKHLGGLSPISENQHLIPESCGNIPRLGENIHSKSEDTGIFIQEPMQINMIDHIITNKGLQKSKDINFKECFNIDNGKEVHAQNTLEICTILEPIADKRKDTSNECDQNLILLNCKNKACDMKSAHDHISRTENSPKTKHSMGSTILEDATIPKQNDTICVFCNFVAPYPSALVLHMKTHKTVNSVKCSHHSCKKSFKNIKVFKRHMLGHLRSKKYICHRCDEAFLARHDMINHIATHKQEQLECKVCNKKFDTIMELISHSKKHAIAHKQFECDICRKVKHSKYHLDVHMRGHVRQQSIFRCGKCRFETISEFSMKIHQRLHSGEKPVICNDCGEGFISPLHLQQHEMKYHNVTIYLDEASN